MAKSYRVVSPIHVQHHLIAEVFFSVYAEMDDGEKMPSPGPGGLRVMRITRAVAVPSVRHIFHIGVLTTIVVLTLRSAYSHPQSSICRHISQPPLARTKAKHSNRASYAARGHTKSYVGNAHRQSLRISDTISTQH